MEGNAIAVEAIQLLFVVPQLCEVVHYPGVRKIVAVASGSVFAHDELCHIQRMMRRNRSDKV